MKIRIIYPYFLDARVHEDEIRVPPLGMFYVAALLKEHGFDVDILNWHDVHRTPERVTDILRTVSPDVIGFSVLHANRWGAIEIARVAKKVNPNVKIVFGGVGATHLWEHFLTHFPEVDYVAIGEAETSFLELVQALDGSEPSAIEHIAGIALRKDNRPHLNPCRTAVRDLDQLPNPAQYFTYQHLSMTRGCPGKCTFCGSPNFWGMAVRSHSPAYFVDELEMLFRKGVAFFHVSDDTFTLKKDRVIAVCREICDRGLDIQWAAISRVDCVDEEVLFWMRKAGCIQISYGVESGSEKIRRKLKKNFSTAQIEKAFALTIRYGILARAYFIYGCPGETDATIQASIDLIRRIRPLSVIFYILDIFPGTRLYEDYLKRAGNNDDIWLDRIEDILYFETDPDLSEEQVLVFGKKLRGAFYEYLPECVEQIELIDRDDMATRHADFLSRLAMTFDHGDYAAVDEIPAKQEIARNLYQKALSYHPDARAYLGLGLLLQKAGRFEASTKLLGEGTGHFPADEQLNVCLGVSYMNLERYEDALNCFEPFGHSKQAQGFIQACRQALR